MLIHSPSIALNTKLNLFQTERSMTEHLSPELANLFLAGLPEKIRSALEARAKAMNYPVWAIVEMAFTKCL